MFSSGMYACHVGNASFDIGPAGIDITNECEPTIEVCYTYSTPGNAFNAYPCSKSITITTPAGTTASGTLTTNFDGDSVSECLVTPLCPGMNAVTFGGNGTTVTGGSVTDNVGGMVDSGVPALDPSFGASATEICLGDEVMLTPNDTRCNALTVGGVPIGNAFTPPTVGTYTVTNTLAGGTACEVSAEMTITVYDPIVGEMPPVCQCAANVATEPLTFAGACSGDVGTPMITWYGFDGVDDGAIDVASATVLQMPNAGNPTEFFPAVGDLDANGDAFDPTVCGIYVFCATVTCGTCESEPVCNTFTIVPNESGVVELEQTVCNGDEISIIDLGASNGGTTDFTLCEDAALGVNCVTITDGIFDAPASLPGGMAIQPPGIYTFYYTTNTPPVCDIPALTDFIDGLCNCATGPSPITITVLPEVMVDECVPQQICFEDPAGQSAGLEATCPECPPDLAATPNVIWYTADDGSPSIGMGSPFDPTGIMSEEGTVYDEGVAGTYTFYHSCECDGCERPLTDFGAGPFTNSDPTDDVITYCVTVSAIGGSYGAGMVTLDDGSGVTSMLPVAAGDTEVTFVDLTILGTATPNFTATFDDGLGAMCVATLETEPFGDCSCYDVVCDDEVMYQAAFTTGAAPGPTGGNITTYVLLSGQGGTILQESPNAQFDVTGLTLGVPYPYHAINYDPASGVTPPAVGGSIGAYINPADECHDVDVSFQCFIITKENLPPENKDATYICEGDPPAELTAPNNENAGIDGLQCVDWNWYDAAVGGNLIFSGQNFTPIETIPGTYQYFISCIDEDGCESDRTVCTYVILERPEAPEPIEVTLCEGEMLPDFLQPVFRLTPRKALRLHL